MSGLAGSRPGRLADAGLALLLLAATAAAYAPALGAGFVWDDDDFVTRNPLLSDQRSLRVEIARHGGWCPHRIGS